MARVICTCERLGQGHHVGLHAKVFVRPELAGTAKTALDLIKDEQSASLVTQLPQALQECLGGHVDATLSLDRLHNDCSSLALHNF